MKSNRRQFLQTTATVALGASLTKAGAAEQVGGAGQKVESLGGADHRSYWISMLSRVAEPVLSNLAENKLKERMPIEAPHNTLEDRANYTYLEALGRTLAGMAPWLELTEKSESESKASERFADLARRGIGNATDSKSPDFMNFKQGGQPLVDAAFLAHAMIRAPRELWQKLEPEVQKRVQDCFRQTRDIKPYMSNWLLFSAMVEAFFAGVGAEWNEAPVEKALTNHMDWYNGDGVYGDGPEFHWDYYNSYVIQPMLLDVLETVGRVSKKWAAMLPKVVARAQRYAQVQERLIAPDGSYPPLGRSICYRCGAFQLLAQMAFRDQLPDSLKAAQVRCALTAVMKRTLGAADTFDKTGWLQVGLAGHQPDLAERYISTGSLYLCTTAFLPLGLAVTHPFWSSPAADWTQRKIWSGQSMSADHAMEEQK